MAFLSRLVSAVSGRNLLRITNISGIKSSQFYARIHHVAKPSQPLKYVLQSTHRRNKSMFTLFRQDTAERLKIKDNIPNDYQLIYRNTMEKYLLMAQVFSTVFAGLVVVYLALTLDQPRDKLILNQSGFVQEVGAVENEIHLYFGLFITVCVLLQLFVKRMPLRIYNQPKQDDYIIVFFGSAPGMKKNLFCKVKEVTKVEEAGLLPWRDSLYEVEKQGKMILIENYFRRPADLHILLGYLKNDYDE